MKKIFIIAFLFFFTSFFLITKVFAADLTVNCDSNGCSPDTSPGIFPDDFWYPGRTVARQIRVNNTGADTLTVSNRSQNSVATGSLDTVMLFSLVRNSDNLVIWSGTLNDFYGAGNISLGSLPAGGNEDYRYTITMDTVAGNEYQSKSTSYDLVLAFSVCNDTKPGSAPILTSAVAGTNSITLFWTGASSPVTYYLVTYGTSPGAQTYGNPNVGGAGTTNYTVSGLSGGTTYYFKVRAGNGCMPGDFSNELAATPGGGFIAGPAAGFIPRVLGTEENLGSGSATVSPELVNILGTQIIPWWQQYWWLLLFPIFGMGAFFLYRRFSSRSSS